MRAHSFANREMAAYYLKELHNRAHTDRKMRVVFLVQDSVIWDKQQPVYDVFAADETVETVIVLVPTYKATDSAVQNSVGRYDAHYWHFFHEHYPNVYDFTNTFDLSVFAPDYIFMASPYEGLRPLVGTRARDLARIAKLCYVAYGTQGLKFFIYSETMMPEFFSHLSFYFCDSEEEKSAMEAAYPLTVNAGVQHFVDIGYPGFEPYLNTPHEERVMRKVLWMPRWNTEERIGGSHFFAFKDAFLAFAEKYSRAGIQFVIRPHPLMFDNFVQKGQMTEQEVRDYKAQLEMCGVTLDEGLFAAEEALRAADILLTDFSSLNMPFFLLERPMIYCPNDSEPTDDYKQMLTGSYVARNWDEAVYHLEHLLRGDDPAAAQRRDIVAAFRRKHTGAAQRVVARIKADYADSLHPAEINLPEIDRWIFEQKKALVSEIGGWRPDLLSHFCQQEWYEGYLVLLQMRVHSENLVWGEQQILAKLQEMYAAAVHSEHRACLTLAMLLYADPLTLPVPLEVDLFPEGLYADLREVFAEQRRVLGIG